MRIAEIFASVQGEGLLTGTPSVFIRASGCNLRCWFCDTRYASWEPEGDDLSVAEILERALEWDRQHVVLTGGEPMLFAAAVPLAAELRRAGKHVTIETAGTLDLPVECDLMSISPKFGSSAPSSTDEPYWRDRHQRSRHAPDVVGRLMRDYDYQIKFVIDTTEDCQAALGYVEEFPEIACERVFLMPQGVTANECAAKAVWIDAFCKQHGFQHCPRRHIEWFGLKRGT